ncbi:YecH family metal-binding protein [Shewanella algidipiscicola]|uniref:YecH family metal-binding protein n=1 Tax=Shewanella algidipiscicola TaxID=614070 RepID=UPI000D787552|nr:YecH family metal-binding protein [Shewanella algidipiscicola]
MSDSIHGHQVMQLMLSLGGAISKTELIKLMATHFGEQATYHTCSATEMSAEQLIAFLERKGKFTESSMGIETAADKICHH